MTQLKERTRRRWTTASQRETAIGTAAVATASELGWMAVAFRDEVLLGIVFGHESQRNARVALERAIGDAGTSLDFLEIDECPSAIRSVIATLTRYAAGEGVDFSGVKIDESHLTPFGRRVIAACRRIAAGKTRSYGELAAAAGSPGAARAVGQVMAGNRYPIVVPCHRVIGANGTIGGFSSPQGLAMKRRMLSLEGQF
jgi:methylated-DNA-[protein]-cysteine S-methyltransferase